MLAIFGGRTNLLIFGCWTWEVGLNIVWS